VGWKLGKSEGEEREDEEEEREQKQGSAGTALLKDYEIAL